MMNSDKNCRKVSGLSTFAYSDQPIPTIIPTKCRDSEELKETQGE